MAYENLQVMPELDPNKEYTIEELTNYIRNAMTGKNVREALARSMEATNEIATWARDVAQGLIDGAFDAGELATMIESKLNQLEQDYAPKLTSLETEIEDARGNESNLGDRLNDFSSQLAQTSEQARASDISDVTLSNKKISSVGLAQKVNMPNSPYGGKEYVHPHRLYFPERWNGYYYWMVVNPYPNSSDIYENPCVYASNDNINWVEPDGISNPLKEWDGDITHYSDPCLVLDKNGRTLHIIHRRSGAGSDNIFYILSSDDGVNWTDQVEVFRRSGVEVVSPVAIQSGNKYYMYYIEVSESGNNKLKRVESFDLLSWSNEVECILNNNNLNLWHIDVIQYGGGLILAANTMDFSRNVLFKSRDFQHFTLNASDFLTRDVVGDRPIYKPDILLIKTDSSLSISLLYNLNGDSSTGGRDWELHHLRVPLPDDNAYFMESFKPRLYYTVGGNQIDVPLQKSAGYYKSINGVTTYYYQLDFSESVISDLPPNHILQMTIPKNGAQFPIVNTGVVKIVGTPTQLTSLTSNISGGGAKYLIFERTRDAQSTDPNMYTHKLAGITRLQGTITYFSEQ